MTGGIGGLVNQLAQAAASTSKGVANQAVTGKKPVQQQQQQQGGKFNLGAIAPLIRQAAQSQVARSRVNRLAPDSPQAMMPNTLPWWPQDRIQRQPPRRIPVTNPGHGGGFPDPGRVGFDDFQQIPNSGNSGGGQTPNRTETVNPGYGNQEPPQIEFDHRGPSQDDPFTRTDLGQGSGPEVAPGDSPEEQWAFQFYRQYGAWPPGFDYLDNLRVQY